MSVSASTRTAGSEPPPRRFGARHVPAPPGLDYRDWFRRNPNPRNRLTRYAEGNLVTPLIDGARFLRELYRMFRATYKDIDPTLPEEAFDPYVPVSDAALTGVSRAKLLLSNAWIDPHTPLLGRRGLIAAPKTQDVAPDDLPSFEVLMSKTRFVAAPGLPGQVDLAASIDDQLKWWLVSEDNVLPPGASIELRQLVFADDFHGDDPRVPGTQLKRRPVRRRRAVPGSAASSRAFASTTGRFAPGRVRARARAHGDAANTLWPPGGGEPAATPMDRSRCRSRPIRSRRSRSPGRSIPAGCGCSMKACQARSSWCSIRER